MIAFIHKLNARFNYLQSFVELQPKVGMHSWILFPNFIGKITAFIWKMMFLNLAIKFISYLVEGKVFAFVTKKMSSYSKKFSTIH